MKGPFPDQTFEPAPACARVRLITGLCFMLSAGGIIVIGILSLREPHIPPSLRMTVLALCLVPGPSIVAGVWLGARLKCYLVSNEALLVKRAFYSPRFDLAGLTSAEPAREPMKGALKIYGNDGLGAIAGSFRSKRWGRFKAYLTDNKDAVVLRWTDGRCVIVSPKHAAFFMQTLRKHLG